MENELRNGYQKADEYVVFHEDDPDLKTMVFRLPKPPKAELIAGYGKRIEDQRFEILQLPPRLKYLEKEALRLLKEENEKRNNFTLTPFKIQRKFWELFESQANKYKSEISFIKRYWWHRLHGYWFYNRGKPTYISGWHFVYLNTWFMSDVKGDRPNYRDRDRKEFLYFDYTYHTKETFAKLDEKGYGIANEDGTYDMVEMEYRTSYGAVQSKNRRSGNTNKGFCCCDEIATRTIGVDVGLGVMSYTSANAGSLFRDKLVEAFFDKPMWLAPFTTSYKNTKEVINLNVGASEYEYQGLKTLMDYASTSSPKYYDSKKMAAALLEEEGKCLGFGTKIRMFDNSIKEVQDIQVGDLLMGDDSNPRTVLKLAQGKEEMYEISPNRRKSWTCNKSHILSLRCSYDFGVKGMKRGDKFDIPLMDYMDLSKGNKTASMLYSVGLNFKAKDHGMISPYMLGLWLGDGSKSSFSVSNIDPEITDYLKDVADFFDLKFKKDVITYHLTQDMHSYYIATKGDDVIVFNSKKEASDHFGVKEISVNWASISEMNIDGYSFEKCLKPNLTRELARIGVLNNKHIPEEYLYDSDSNRLELLAGLIDSDGFLNKAKNGYEITQVRKDLSYDIRRLVLDLGFYCSITHKKTSMKRADGSMFRGEAYRLKIHGKDLHRIPCKVARKQTYNRMNNRHFVDSTNVGFKVESIGIGDYYGFVIDGNHRFLLEDNTVMHNTEEVNISDRWGVVKLCLSQGNGKIIHGWSYHPSTVEETSSNSADFKFLIESSDFFRRVRESGQTYSGLMRVFVAGDEGSDGYIDSYGYSIKGEIQDYQKEEGFTETATDFLQGIRDAFLRAGDMEKYRGEKKRAPLKFADSWLGDTGALGFDLEKIDRRLEQLGRNREDVKGNLEWIDGFGSDVAWVQDEENGRFNMSMNAPKAGRNKKVKVLMYSVFEDAIIPQWRPAIADKFVLGADPYGFSNEQQAKAKKKKTGSSSKLSDGGIAVYWKYDASIDGDRTMNEWESGRFVLSYRARVGNDDDYNEDVLKAAIYFGAHVYPETNKESTYKYFIKHEFGGYLLYDTDSITGKPKEKPGVHSLQSSKLRLFSLVKNYIDQRGDTESFIEFLEECKDINSMEDMTHFDRLTAHGLALMGDESTYSGMFSEDDIANTNVNLDDFMEVYWG